MTTLDEFLLARIAEDNAAWGGAGIARADLSGVETVTSSPQLTQHMISVCEANRQAVGFAAEVSEMGDQLGARVDQGDRLLRILALPYADHRDYSPDWKNVT